MPERTKSTPPARVRSPSRVLGDPQVGPTAWKVTLPRREPSALYMTSAIATQGPLAYWQGDVGELQLGFGADIVA